MPWSRFPIEEISAADGDLLAQLPRYLAALNNYFQHDPYNTWFKKPYEPALEGMEASYYSGTQTTAIHTDVCSPVPTSPTWRGLEQHEKRALAADGVSLWHRLIEELEPEVILASLRKEHLARITLPIVSKPEVILSVPQKTPCQVVARRVRCGEGEAVSSHELLRQPHSNGSPTPTGGPLAPREGDA